MNTENSYTHPTYPCHKWLQSRKGKGDHSMWGKGAKGGNYLPPLRQGKTCMVKAKPLKTWSQGIIGNGGERVVVKPSRFVASYVAFYDLQLSQTGLLSIREIKGPNGTPNHVDSSRNRTPGLPKQVARFGSGTCKATERPYYSRLACNGFSRQATSLYRHGHKLAAMRTKTPLSGRKGRSLIRAINRKGGYADAT